MNTPYTSEQQGHSHENMAVVCGNANPALSGKICESLRMSHSRAVVDTFSDGEVHVEFIDNVRGKDIYIIQPLCRPVNRNLMELVLLADAARRSSARSVCAVIPYLGYSRQDRRPRGGRTPISARVVADILTVAGINRMLTIDLHTEQIQGFYAMPVDNLYASPVLLGDLGRQVRAGKKSPVVPMMISPDVGGVQRARVMASLLDADLAIIDKRRLRTNVAEVMNIIGKVKGRHCFLIDDMIDTAGTLCTAAQAIKDAGAASVRAYCTHLVLSGAAVSRINESVLLEVVGTDTIPLSKEAQACDKIRTLSVAELLAETLSRIDGQRSVGSLFMS